MSDPQQNIDELKKRYQSLVIKYKSGPFNPILLVELMAICSELGAAGYHLADNDMDWIPNAVPDRWQVLDET